MKRAYIFSYNSMIRTHLYPHLFIKRNYSIFFFCFAPLFFLIFQWYNYGETIFTSAPIRSSQFASSISSNGNLIKQECSTQSIAVIRIKSTYKFIRCSRLFVARTECYLISLCTVCFSCVWFGVWKSVWNERTKRKKVGYFMLRSCCLRNMWQILTDVAAGKSPARSMFIRI